jgi:hypothetical protein
MVLSANALCLCGLGALQNTGCRVLVYTLLPVVLAFSVALVAPSPVWQSTYPTPVYPKGVL